MVEIESTDIANEHIRVTFSAKDKETEVKKVVVEIF